MELRRLLLVVRHWLWLIVAAAVLAGAAAFVGSAHMTKMYRATATLIINQGQAATGPTYSDVLANQQLATTYASVATSRPVLAAAVKSLPVAGGSISSRCPCVLEGKETLLEVSTNVPLNTELVQVNAVSPSPSLAAGGANAVAASFSEAIKQAQLSEADSEEQGLSKQIADSQARIQDINGRMQNLSNQPPPSDGANGTPQGNTAAQAASFQTQLSQEQTAYATLVGQLEQIRLAQSKATNVVKTIEPAVVPAAPFSPRTTLNIALGAVLGLLGAAGAAFLFEYLDDTVRSPEDVTRVSPAASTLGIVERFDAGHETGLGVNARMLLQPDASTSKALEEYRLVRMNLEFARAGRHIQTLVVTSANEGEGKTTTAANLAIVLSQTGKRVLLVDADLRRPSLHGLFDLPNGAGFSTLFLSEEIDPRSVAHATGYENLSVLTSGPLPPNPPELLGSPRMRQLVALFASAFDLVLFDSPPLLPVADATEVSARVDATILVVDTGKTRSAAVARAVESLERATATLVGVVLNKLQRRRARTDYYYSYYSYPGHYGSSGANGGSPKISTNGHVRSPAPASGAHEPSSFEEGKKGFDRRTSGDG